MRPGKLSHIKEEMKALVTYKSKIILILMPTFMKIKENTEKYLTITFNQSKIWWLRFKIIDRFNIF